MVRCLPMERSALPTLARLAMVDEQGHSKTWNQILNSNRGALSETERLDYISALQCLMTQPPRTPSSLAPGAKSRYDDFQVTHMNQMMSIHNTANFLSWHRYFVWLFEEALRTECGYKGASPVSTYLEVYIGWPRTQKAFYLPLCRYKPIKPFITDNEVDSTGIGL